MNYDITPKPTDRCITCGRLRAEVEQDRVPTSYANGTYGYESGFRCYEAGKVCARCHKERQLRSLMKSMDAYAERHGEEALANIFGLKGETNASKNSRNISKMSSLRKTRNKVNKGKQKVSRKK